MRLDREREEAVMREMLRMAIEPAAPGLADRVLAAVAREPERQREPRAHWAFSLVAVALTAALVVTLAYGARLSRQPAVPGSHAAPSEARPAAVPVSGAAVRPFLTPAAGGWLAVRSGGRTTLSQTTDGGLTWAGRLVYDGGLPSQVIVDASGAGVVVGGQRDEAAADLVLFRTTDGGASWSRVTAPLGVAEWGVPYFADAGRGWVLASLGPGSAEILSTRDGGRTWLASAPFNDRANFPGLSSVRLRILWTGDGHGIVVLPAGAGSTAVHVILTDDGGATWRASFPAVPSGLAVSAANAVLDAGLLPDGRGTLFLQAIDAGRRGVPALFAYATTDAGRSWSQPVQLDGPLPAGPARVVFALDDAHWWASSGSGADLLVTADRGRTVQRHTHVLPRGYAFQSIGFRSGGEGWAVATNDGRAAVFVSHDGGATWRPLNPPA